MRNCVLYTKMAVLWPENGTNLNCAHFNKKRLSFKENTRFVGYHHQHHHDVLCITYRKKLKHLITCTFLCGLFSIKNYYTPHHWSFNLWFVSRHSICIFLLFFWFHSPFLIALHRSWFLWLWYHINRKCAQKIQANRSKNM